MAYPTAMFAVIDEARCIGCTKCQQVCPKGAVVGARRMVHTVLEEACHACGLCLPVCPTACICWNHDAPAGGTRAPERPSMVSSPPCGAALPAEMLAKVAAARSTSRQRYEARGPLNQPKALRTKQAGGGAKAGPSAKVPRK